MSYLAPTLNGQPMDETNDLAAEPFYIMAALGPLTDNGGIGEDVMAAVSEESYMLAEPTSQKTTTSKSSMSSSVSAVNIFSGVLVALYATLN